jgi:hypothetical protein
VPLIVLAALVLIAPSPLGAQPPPPGLPPLLPRAEEIALARSAAPPSVSDSATVFVLERGGFVMAEQGSSGVTCLVNRTHPAALEPHCYDAEGSRTILPIRLAEARLREAGRSDGEIEAAVAAGIRNGEFELPARAAMSYMMSAAQVLHDDAGRRVGAWRPHLMIYLPFIRPADLGVSGSGEGGAPVVADAGGALASVVVVVPDFVVPRPPLPGGP